MAVPEEPRPAGGAGEVAGRRFAVGFRGYDQAEVRAFLAEVQAELDGLRAREAALQAELARVRAEGVAGLDESTVAALVGEEAARLITTARDGAAQIRARAEEDAGRIQAEARAEGDAEGKSLLAEALGLRSRMLEDLGARRRAARAQHDQLCAGREDVLIALTRVQRAVASALEEIRAAVPEPLGSVDLSTELGVEVAGFELVPSAPDHARSPARSPAPAVERAPEPEPAVAPEPEPAVAPEPETEPEADAAPAVAPEATPEPEADAGPAVAPEPETEPEAAPPATPEAEAPPPITPEPEAPPPATPEPVTSPAASSRAVDDVFARLRAERAQAVADARHVLARIEPDPAGDAAAEPHDDAANLASVPAPPRDAGAAFLAERDAALEPVERAVARALKRVLADEQNQVLDRLRRAPAGGGVDALLGDVGAQAQRYRAAVAPALAPALQAGLAVGGGPGAQTVIVLDDVRDAVLATLGPDLVAPLRERVDRALASSGGDGDEASAHLRATYREWRDQRLDPLAAQLALAAHGAASVAGLAPGTPVRWVVEPASACPDADDNALAGAVPCGQTFPTGHTHAPAHPGCRCAVVPA